MKRKKAKQLNKEIYTSGLISKEIYAFLEQEIEHQLDEEIQEEKSRVRDKINKLFDNDYVLASAFFKQSLEVSY